MQELLGTGVNFCKLEVSFPIQRPEIILEELEICTKTDIKSDEKNDLGLASDLNMVYSCLDLRPKNLDHIIRKTGFSPGKTAGILGQLILMGLVKETGRQYYIRLE